MERSPLQDQLLFLGVANIKSKLLSVKSDFLKPIIAHVSILYFCFRICTMLQEAKRE
jgi:hypothetical protein